MTISQIARNSGENHFMAMVRVPIEAVTRTKPAHPDERASNRVSDS
jgi:hypothetical protein